MSDLVNLTWQAQVIIVGGYLGYVIAYAGRRRAHTSLDAGGIILCFGGVGLLCLAISERILKVIGLDLDELLGVIAVLAPIFAAILWRRSVRDWVSKKLRKIAKLEEDGFPTAWESVIQTGDLDHAQLAVTLEDGTVYESYPLVRFQDHPNGPCVYGSDGSIAMYVTTITTPDNSSRPTNLLEDADGIRMTVIPESKIAEIDIRRSPKHR